MDLALIHKIIVILISAIGLWLAFWVYFVNRKAKVNRLFFFMVIFNLFFITLNYLTNIATFTEQALSYRRLAFGIISLYFIINYFFVKYFPKEDKKYPFLDKSIIIFGVPFFFLSAFTDSIVKNVVLKEWGAEIIKGELIDTWLIGLAFWIFLILGLLFKKYFRLEKEEKLKVQYFLIGASIFGFSNLVFSIILLIFYDTYQYYWIGDYSAIFLFGFTAYAIIKQELFGIKTLLTHILVGTTAIILLLLPFLIEGLSLAYFKLLLFIVFFLFCVIGYLLIQYTHREVKQKEILEEKVKERTKELQTAYEDIKKRKEELERVLKAVVGRELRMVELKKEIKEKSEKIRELEKK